MRRSAEELKKEIETDFNDILAYYNLVVNPESSRDDLERTLSELRKRAPEIRRTLKYNEFLNSIINFNPNLKTDEEKLREFIEEMNQKDKKPGPGEIKIGFNVTYENRANVEYTSNERKHYGWEKVAEYGEDGKLITPYETVNRILNYNMFKTLGFNPEEREYKYGQEPAEPFKIEMTSDKKYLTAFLLRQEVYISVIVNIREYSIFQDIYNKVGDIYMSMLEFYISTGRDDLDFIIGANSSYPDALRYISSNNLIVTDGNITLAENQQSADIMDIPLFGKFEYMSTEQIMTRNLRLPESYIKRVEKSDIINPHHEEKKLMKRDITNLINPNFERDIEDLTKMMKKIFNESKRPEKNKNEYVSENFGNDIIKIENLNDTKFLSSLIYEQEPIKSDIVQSNELKKIDREPLKIKNKDVNYANDDFKNYDAKLLNSEIYDDERQTDPLQDLLNEYCINNGQKPIKLSSSKYYTLEGTIYGNKTGQCVPHAIASEWKIKEINNAPDVYNVNWLINFAQTNKLSLLLVDGDNEILARVIGDHDIMNHKKTLIGTILNSHISVVEDPDLRKSYIERSKKAKSEIKNRFCPDAQESEFEKLLSKSLKKAISTEDEERIKRDCEKKAKEIEEKQKKMRKELIERYLNRADCHNIEELAEAVENDKHIYYHSDFNSAVAYAINNMYNSENVNIIPIARGKLIKFKKGKISAIKLNNSWIRPANDIQNLKLFEKIYSNFEGPEFEHVTPHMSLSELTRKIKEKYAGNYISTLNNHTLNFLDSRGCIEFCRSLISDLDDYLLRPSIEPNLYSLDIAKAFQVASISQKFGCFGLYNGCEIYEKFDGSIIKNAFYFVESDSKHPFFRGNGPYEGNAINYMIKYDVINILDVKLQCIPFNTYNQWINFICGVNNLFTPGESKDIINQTVGCMKPNLDRIYSNHCLTMDINIIHRRLSSGKKQKTTAIKLNEDKTLWHICEVGDLPRFKTAHPLRMAIIDRLLCMMLDLNNEIIIKGGTPLFIKTDCIYYHTNKYINFSQLEAEYRQSLPEEAKKIKDFCIFKMKKEDNFKYKHQTRNKNISLPPNISSKGDILTTDNGCDSAFIEKLYNLPAALIESPGGHGKTETLKALFNYFESRNEKALKCAFTNAVKLLTGGDTFHATFTMSKLSNKFYKIEKRLREIANKYKAILCDECSMITGDIYECLTYMKYHNPDIKIYLFGNWRQCLPVEPGKHIKYQDLPLVNWLTGNNKIFLNKNWRVDPEEYIWAEYLKNDTTEFYYTKSKPYYNDPSRKFITYHLSDSIKPFINTSNTYKEGPINIAYTNKKCEEINKAYNKKIAEYLIKTGKPCMLAGDIVLHERLRLIGECKIINYTQKLLKKIDKKIKKNINAKYNYTEIYEIDKHDLEKLRDDLKFAGENDNLFTNEHYIVESFSKETGLFTVTTNPEFHSYTKRATYKISDLNRFFNLGYCFTIHSVQGLTIRANYTIHEYEKMLYFGEQNFYTAISRASNPKKITVIC